MSASYLPSILVPTVGLILPFASMAILFIAIEK
uniref:Photosystem I reaction center subunit VIII n=2 Tax=Cyanidioschyzon merolae TaxID=45157 RepID=Q85FQ6_CYAM1|nr:photosystem I reaction center subunit IV [Cyanidioschyzon merolae strain 10D]5ZGB_I Chain I, PsaI [Cyanidioschyzon merolae strain 10D]5ZGH_I Chain I, PsaI [Cyanidioschyzon merolae strain 10D]6FOS_I Chain I, Photosystem I reaction center subunit VIII [Cyanidioschyzon merolae strain 10D]QFV17073.1 photosystem I reaction center subunit IV [Cyanidioschyzon merolae]QFV17246.1 photosystem I reaction center subunit IV [Cyanidioschyzon merolae]BAC76289.1 photosystem I reaction center subunit IV [C